jgi:hypothetical protein
MADKQSGAVVSGKLVSKSKPDTYWPWIQSNLTTVSLSSLSVTWLWQYAPLFYNKWEYTQED